MIIVGFTLDLELWNIISFKFKSAHLEADAKTLLGVFTIYHRSKSKEKMITMLVGNCKETRSVQHKLYCTGGSGGLDHI